MNGCGAVDQRVVVVQHQTFVAHDFLQNSFPPLYRFRAGRARDKSASKQVERFFFGILNFPGINLPRKKVCYTQCIKCRKYIRKDILKACTNGGIPMKRRRRRQQRMLMLAGVVALLVIVLIVIISSCSKKNQTGGINAQAFSTGSELVLPLNAELNSGDYVSYGGYHFETKTKLAKMAKLITKNNENVTAANYDNAYGSAVPVHARHGLGCGELVLVSAGPDAHLQLVCLYGLPPRGVDAGWHSGHAAAAASDFRQLPARQHGKPAGAGHGICLRRQERGGYHAGPVQGVLCKLRALQYDYPRHGLHPDR